ncbi:MAG TPA: hypothetical protein PLL57_13875 [Flavobacteriales bacterium]|nr:hypothetical protein [Flavobacteriales bacterium]
MNEAAFHLRPGKKDRSAVLVAAGLLLCIGIFFGCSSSSEMPWYLILSATVLPCLGGTFLLFVWFKLYRSSPSWVTVSDSGLELPFIAPATIPWNMIHEVSEYYMFRGDSGMKVRVENAVVTKAWARLIVRRSRRSAGTKWIFVSVINLEMPMELPDWIVKLEQIRRAAQDSRPNLIQKLGVHQGQNAHDR